MQFSSLSIKYLPLRSFLDVRLIGKTDSSNTSKPHLVEVTLKYVFDRRVVMSCAI